jgi:AcrR family transcriptional regulator
MFIERGFDQVTISQVAEAAGVAKMTVTNYFPRKEDLLLDLHEEIVHGLARTVDGRRDGEPVLAAVRRAYFEGLERRDAMLGFSGSDFARLVLESPTLLARLRELWEQREAALAAALVAVLGDELKARIVAAQLATVDRVLSQEVMRRAAAGEAETEIVAVMTEVAGWAFDSLGDGLT